jgi:hypothetical protein
MVELLPSLMQNGAPSTIGAGRRQQAAADLPQVPRPGGLICTAPAARPDTEPDTNAGHRAKHR